MEIVKGREPIARCPLPFIIFKSHKVELRSMIRFDSMDRPIEGGKFSNATFGRIKPIVLGFDPLSLLIRTNPRTIGLIRLKVAGSIFHIFSTDSTFGKSRKKKSEC